MKKKLTILFALLCASMMSWADPTPYCGETSPNENFTFSLMNVSGNLYRIQFDAIGDVKFGSTPYNVNCGVNQSAGAGIFFGGENAANWIMTDDRAYFEFSTASETSMPTGFYGNYFCFNKKGGGLIEISAFNPEDIDWTATCGASCDDSQKPSVTDVNVGDIAYNSAVLTITANDNIGVTRYVVKNGDVQLAQGASNVIILTGLTPSTAYDNIKVFAYDACNNESDAFSVSSFNTEALTYCRFATGHLGQANFGDQFGRILLTIKKVNETTIAVKVEPNNNGTRGIKYMNIIVNGTSHEFGNNDGSGEDLTGFYEISGLASLDFTFNLFFYCNTPNWTTNQFNVTAAELCEETTELSVGSEYCTYYGDETKTGSRYATLTWETNEDGDVVITIGDGPGETNTAFRSNGLGNDLSGFSVLSGAGFATSEPASDYFNRVYGGAGTKTYILQKKGGVTLPSPAKIHFQGKAFEWKCTEEGNAYTNPTFEYTYGKICSQLDAPAHVAIDGTNHITFDAVAGADSYKAYVSLGGVEKYSQTVASGDELTFVPLVSGDYTVNVIASGAGKVDSDPSADYVWQLVAAPIVLGNSEYCEKNMSSGNTEAAFTWETDGSGNIVITISEVLDGANDPAHFRANAFKDGLKVGTSKENLSNYFNIPATIDNADHSQKTLTYTLKDPANAPAPGEKIYYNGVVEYRTSQNTDAWPTISFEYTYGTVCSGKSVSASVNNSTMGSAVVKVGDDEVTSVDEGTSVSFIATVADPALYRFVNWTKGGVEVSTEATYVATITETTNLVANFDYIREAYCHYELLSNESAVQGKKLYMTVGAIGGGDYRIMFEGSAEAPFTGLQDANFVINQVTAKTDVDGQPKTGQDVPFTKTNGRWNFSAEGYGKAWIEFSLAEGKTIDDIYVWANAIYFNTANGVLGYVDNNDRLKLFGMNAAKCHNIDWDATCSDTEAPVFGKAEAEVLNETSVQLKIQATDNWEGLLTYTIARAGASDIILNGASGEELTQEVTGLTTNTEYDFTVTVSDGVNDAVTHIVVTPIADNEKPEMTSASLDSKTWNSAIINVAATDNKGVTAYYIVELAAEYVATDGKITVTGLTAATAYTFTITAKDAAGNTSDNQAEVSFTTDAHLLAPATAAPVPTLPANQVKSLYSNTYDFAPASLSSYNECWWECPNMSEGNIDGNTYLLYDLYRNGMIGAQFAETSMSLMEKIHIDIWASAAGSIKFRPITNGGPNTPKTLNLAAQQWNSFDIDLSEYAGHDWSKVFQFAIEGYQDGGLVGEHISVDNIFFYRTTPPPADETAPTDVIANKTEENFASVKLSAQANDDSGVVHFRVQNGSDVLVADVEAVSGAEVAITINNLTPNTDYTLSVVAFDEAGHEAEPVNVAVKTKALPSAAPQPTHVAEAVLSVYSNAYDPAVAATFNRANWGSAPVELESDYILYSMSANVIVWGNNDGNPNHGNIDALSGKTHGETPGLDVSGMTYIHFDVWCEVADQLNTVNINDQAVSIPTTRTIAGEWVSFDVDITGVALADRQNVRWLKFHPFTNCFAAIDNVYFWKAPKYTRDDDWMAPGELGTVCYPEGLVVAGATMYKMAGTDANGKFVFDEVDVLEPGVPYLFEAHANALHFYATAAPPATEAGTSNGMVGTFADKVIPQNSPNIYYFSGTKFYAVTARSTDLTVPANRAYVDLTAPHPAGAPRAGVRRVVFDVQGSNAATGFGEVQGDELQSTKVLINGHLFIRRGEKTYDATGSLVK